MCHLVHPSVSCYYYLHEITNKKQWHNEICTLLGYYAAYGGIPYRDFGTTTLQMRAVGCPETSVWNYHTMLRNIPEERRSHLYRGGSLSARSSLQI